MLRSIRTLRSIPRVKDITLILLKHGVYQVASHLGAPFRMRVRGILRSPFGHPVRQAERLRLAFQELGPTFIKLGQLIANRPDLFPPAMVQEFAKLENRVDSIPFPDIKAAIERELGVPITEHFSDVDEKPLASASIAQVHRATLKDGTKVVLKVQKPGIDRIIDRDMEILALVANALSKVEDFGLFDPEGLVAEVHRSLERELRFTFERNAIDRVRKNFEKDEVMVVPRTFPRLSSDRLLVLECLDGTAIRNYKPPSQEEATRHAREVTRILFLMIFRDGYFHGDPHASNILVLNDGRLGWLDFGSMGLFTSEMRHTLMKMLRALLDRDYERLARQVLHFGRNSGDASRFEFTQDLANRLDPYFGLTLQEIDLGALFTTIVDLARDHRVSMSPSLLAMTRCLVLVESLAHQLDPELDTMEAVTPLARQYLLHQMRPDVVVDDVLSKLTDLASQVLEYPNYATEIMRRLAAGQLNIDTHVQGLEGLNERLRESSTTIAQAMVVSALLVASALVMDMKGPTLWDLNLLGVVGYTIAAVLGLLILLRIVRG
ncbi:MAG: AarF/UbiB family protein [Planctomycetota bacterium]